MISFLMIIVNYYTSYYFLFLFFVLAGGFCAACCFSINLFFKSSNACFCLLRLDSCLGVTFCSSLLSVFFNSKSSLSFIVFVAFSTSSYSSVSAKRELFIASITFFFCSASVNLYASPATFKIVISSNESLFHRIFHFFHCRSQS